MQKISRPEQNSTCTIVKRQLYWKRKTDKKISIDKENSLFNSNTSLHNAGLMPEDTIAIKFQAFV